MENIFIGNFSLYQLFFYFFIYSFLGWVVEVIYSAVNTGKLVNRGFLTGPCCPIYGIGALLVLLFLTPLKDNYFLLFALSVIFTTLIELVTGLILDYFFHKKWWDYSKVPFNFHGYICIKFSILWGFVCMFGLLLVQPAVAWVVNQVPVPMGKIWITTLIIFSIIDLIIVIIQVSKLNEHLNRLALFTEEVERGKQAVGQEINERINILKSKKLNYTEWRIFKAFPNMISRNNKEAFEEMKNQARKRKTNNE